MVEIITDNESITATGDHPFNEKEKGIIAARFLQSGDILDSTNKEGVVVRDVKVLNKVASVYEIVVDGNHNYYIGSEHILVHNEHLKN